MTLNTALDLWKIWTVAYRGTPGTFWRHCSQSCVYYNEKIWHPGWKIPLEHPWKRDFRDSKSQNVSRCLSPKKLVPLVRSSKAAYYSLSACYLKTFSQPCLIVFYYNIVMENQTVSCLFQKSSFFLFLLVSNVCVYILLFTWHFWCRFPATIQREGFRG